MKDKKIVFVVFVLLLFTVVFFIKRSSHDSILNQYSKQAQIALKENSLEKQVTAYSKTLDFMASSSSFKKDYFFEYSKIVYQEKENFAFIIDTLLEKKYSSEEINLIFEYLSDANIQKLLNHEYISLASFYEIPNLDVDKIADYLAYQSLKQISLKDAVTQVNLHLNESFYTNVSLITDPDDIRVLVNKYHALPEDYVPKDLVFVGTSSLKMRKEAAEALEKLIAAASLENRILIPYSTYRSYAYQKGLYERYLERDPGTVVDTYSARPGHSEHQTGLACDIRSNGLVSTLSDRDYEWMLAHSYEYGFIVRYPKNESVITGYQEEPWHIRYIGYPDAKKVHELGITYDEYYDLFLEVH